MKVLRSGFAAVYVLTAGCTLTPVDGQVVSSTTAAVSFSGLSTQSSKPVRVEVLSGSAPGLLPPTATTSSTVTLTDDGVDYFGWGLNATIPPSGWVAGTTGAFTKLRTRFIGAGVDGSDAYGYTFRPDWSSCHVANPNLGNFLSRCQSARSPLLFLYTSDFPAGADLIIRDLLRPVVVGGRVQVIVRNNGRPGVVSSVTCSRIGAIGSVTVGAAINPGDERTVEVFVGGSTSGVSVTCTVAGTNEDGSAEPNTANNSRVERL